MCTSMCYTCTPSEKIASAHLNVETGCLYKTDVCAESKHTRYLSIGKFKYKFELEIETKQHNVLHKEGELFYVNDIK